MAKCKGKTKSNKPCQREGGDDGWCYQHQPSAKDDSNELTDKQAAFVREYLVDLNGAAAARRAGYSKESARQIATENLSKPYIRAAIEERLEQQAMSANEVLARLTRIARGSLELFTEIVELEDGGKYRRVDLASDEAQNNFDLLTSLSYDAMGRPKIKISDPMSALVHIGRAHAMFTDNQQLTVKRPEEDMSEEELEKEIERLDDIIDDAG